MIRLLILVAVFPATEAFFTLYLATTVNEKILGVLWVIVSLMLVIAALWPHQFRRKIGGGYIAGYKMTAYSDGSILVATGSRKVRFASIADAERIFAEDASKTERVTRVPIEFEGWGHGFDERERARG